MAAICDGFFYRDNFILYLYVLERKKWYCTLKMDMYTNNFESFYRINQTTQTLDDLDTLFDVELSRFLLGFETDKFTVTGTFISGKLSIGTASSFNFGLSLLI